MRRRTFLITSAAALSQAAFPSFAWAVPKPYSWEAMPPNANGDAFVKWMVANRGESPHFLGQRFSRYTALVANRDVLHKIGVTGGNVARRLANARLDPTFLMAAFGAFPLLAQPILEQIPH